MQKYIIIASMNTALKELKELESCVNKVHLQLAQEVTIKVEELEQILLALPLHVVSLDLGDLFSTQRIPLDVILRLFTALPKSVTELVINHDIIKNSLNFELIEMAHKLYFIKSLKLCEINTDRKIKPMSWSYSSNRALVESKESKLLRYHLKYAYPRAISEELAKSTPFLPELNVLICSYLGRYPVKEVTKYLKTLLETDKNCKNTLKQAAKNHFYQALYHLELKKNQLHNQIKPIDQLGRSETQNFLALESLHQSLKLAANDFFKTPILPSHYQYFKTTCYQQIAKARNDLDHYDIDCKQILGNLGLAILGCVVFYFVAILVNKAINGHYLFFRPEPVWKMDELDNAIQMLHP